MHSSSLANEKSGDILGVYCTIQASDPPLVSLCNEFPFFLDDIELYKCFLANIKGNQPDIWLCISVVIYEARRPGNQRN